MLARAAAAAAAALVTGAAAAASATVTRVAKRARVMKLVVKVKDGARELELDVVASDTVGDVRARVLKALGWEEALPEAPFRYGLCWSHHDLDENKTLSECKAELVARYAKVAHSVERRLLEAEAVPTPLEIVRRDVWWDVSCVFVRTLSGATLRFNVTRRTLVEDLVAMVRDAGVPLDADSALVTSRGGKTLYQSDELFDYSSATGSSCVSRRLVHMSNRNRCAKGRAK